MSPAQPDPGPSSPEPTIDPDLADDLAPLTAPSAERMARLRAAAYAAELSTGHAERTEVSARRSLIARIAIIAAGTLVTLAGLVMFIIPGPGLVVTIAGLGILATEVSWAERLLAYAKQKARVEEITAQRPWVKPVSIAVTVTAVVVSLLYTFRWR